MHGDVAPYGQLGPGNLDTGHDCSAMVWRWKVLHQVGLSSCLLQVWGGKGHLLLGMGKEQMEGEEISVGGGRGVPPVQTALLSLK